MTYLELIKECHDNPDLDCSVYCKYRKECNAFEYETSYPPPCLFNIILNLDKEIEVEENEKKGT